MSTILVVDDDPNIRELVSVFLRRAGFAVIEAADGRAALAQLDQGRADLAILDVMMPLMDGWELLGHIRATSDMPMLMLTVNGETAQKVRGFQLGADDYLVKPFDPLELVERVKALLRRYRIVTSQRIQIHELLMDRSSFSVTLAGAAVALPRKEFELLFTLAGAPGRTFTRDQLITEIWGYDFAGNERTLDVHINRLRERFPEGRHSFLIRTVRGLGYRLEVRP
jgi:DNA-binding response OmpR family regulator